MSLKNYQHKGLDFDKKILNNMLSLWSPYLELNGMSFHGLRSNPTYSVEVSYDFRPLKEKWAEAKVEGGELVRHLGWSLEQYASLYPVMENLNLLNPKKAGYYLAWGINDEGMEWKEGHYYMGVAKFLVIYIDKIEYVENDYGITDKKFTVLFLNLRADYRGPAIFKEGDKGVCYPYFNITQMSFSLLQDDYRIDVTEWIDGSVKVRFMNWDGNPLNS